MCKNNDNGVMQLYADDGYVSGMATSRVLRPPDVHFEGGIYLP